MVKLATNSIRVKNIWSEIVVPTRFNNPSSNISQILLNMMSNVQSCHTMYTLQLQMG